MFLPVKRVSIQGYPSAPIVPCLDAEKPLLGVEGFSADTATCIGMRQEARHNLSGVLPSVANAMMPPWQDRRLAPYSAMEKTHETILTHVNYISIMRSQRSIVVQAA